MTVQSICEEQATGAEVLQASGSNVRASWISTAAEFARLGAEWDHLFQRANPENAFLSFGWMSTWWKHFGSGQLAVIAVRRSDGRLAAVAPFYIERSFNALGARRLGFLGDDRVGSDHLGVLADAELGTAPVQEIARILSVQHRSWDYIELRDCAASPLMATLSAELAGRGMQVIETNPRVCRYIPLPATFEKYLAGIGISLRANYRRRWRALQREHQAECITISGAAELSSHFPALLALHRMRFEQRAADSAFLAPRVPEFHAEALRVMAAQGFARMFLLKAGGEIIAAIYGFSVGRTFQFYQCGMHPGWVKYGLGQVLIGNAIDQNIAAGQATFDFLRGDESYKTQWAEQAHANTTLRFFDQRPGSVAARWGLRTSAALRGLARKAKARMIARRGAEKGDG